MHIWRLDSFEPAICHLATYCLTIIVSFLYLCTMNDCQCVSVSCSTLHLVPTRCFGRCLLQTDFFEESLSGWWWASCTTWHSQWYFYLTVTVPTSCLTYEAWLIPLCDSRSNIYRICILIIEYPFGM